MPELTGLQMADKIREIKPDAKIIVLTGNTAKPTFESTVENGFEINHYIMKPINFKVLFSAIKQCLDQSAQQVRA
jgi:YesN/AraC family two-component response regulator